MSYLGSWKKDCQAVSTRARKILENPGAAILDTETTGLANTDRIVDIAVISTAGKTLLNQRVNPEIPISQRASRIHRITSEMVAGEPLWPEVFANLVRTLEKNAINEIVIYNRAFDTRLIAQSNAAHPECKAQWEMLQKNITFRCAMNAYAAWCGDWQEWSQDYRWQKLPGGDHTALGDCHATLKVIRKMAEQ